MLNIENARSNNLPDGKYTATMTKPDEGRIYSEREMGATEAIQYAKEAIKLGWTAEVIGPDSRIYFIGGPA